MGSFSSERLMRAPLERVWPLLLDWSFGAEVPFTEIRIEPAAGLGAGAETVAGQRFVARTGIGPGRRAGFDDLMTVTSVRPPSGDRGGRAVVLKHGRLLRGEALIEARRHGPAHTLVIWSYRDLRLVPQWLSPPLATLTARATDRVTDRTGAAVAKRVLAAVARAAEHGRAGDRVDTER